MSSRLTFALRSLAIPVVIGAIVFSAAGRCDFPFIWALLGVMWLFYLTLSMVRDAGMAQERQSPGPGNQDRLTQPIAAVLMLTHWIIAGLDIGRFHWSPTPWGLQLGGLLFFWLHCASTFGRSWRTSFIRPSYACKPIGGKR